jgi:hypothetical protein
MALRIYALAERDRFRRSVAWGGGCVWVICFSWASAWIQSSKSDPFWPPRD